MWKLLWGAGLFSAVLCINVAWQRGPTLCQECFMRGPSQCRASLVNSDTVRHCFLESRDIVKRSCTRSPDYTPGLPVACLAHVVFPHTWWFMHTDAVRSGPAFVSFCVRKRLANELLLWPLLAVHGHLAELFIILGRTESIMTRENHLGRMFNVSKEELKQRETWIWTNSVRGAQPKPSQHQVRSSKCAHCEL